MGRYYSDKKITVESCLNFDIRSLRKSGFLNKRHDLMAGVTKWSNSTSSIDFVVFLQLKMVNLSYVVEEKSYNYDIHLGSTPCYLGGGRFWFICPIEGCRRRVAVLYLPSGAESFACRHCYNLTYQSVQRHNQRADQWMHDLELWADLLNSKDARKSLLGRQKRDDKEDA